MTDEVLNQFNMSLRDAVGRVWPITLVNDLTNEKIKRPFFQDIQAEAVGEVFRVRGEFFDGSKRTVIIHRNAALASINLAAKEAVSKLKLSKETTNDPRH